MQTAQKSNETINIPREKFLTLVSQMFGGASGNPNPDEPHKPGPWEPIIRKVAGQFFGPFPEPWRLAFSNPASWLSESNQHRAFLEFLAHFHPEIWDVIGGGHIFSRAAAELNPQPLPPRAAFLAAFIQEVIDRAVLTQEIADSLIQTGDERGIIIVSGRIKQFITDIDELCPRIPKKFPKPKGFEYRFSALELLMAGGVCSENADTVANDNLQQEIRNAGVKLIEIAIDRM
jgi:hypothetical protein